MTLKILVNLGALRPPLTGIGRYVFNLVGYLTDSNEVEDIVGFDLSGRLYDRARVKEILRDLESNHVTPTGGRKGRVRALIYFLGQRSRLLKKLRVLVVGLRLRARARSLRDYIYWEPSHELIPFVGASLYTIYDLSYIRCPQFHPQQRSDDLHLRVKNAIRDASAILTISDFTKAEILSEYHPAVPVFVVAPGVSEEFYSARQGENKETLEKYGLSGNYCISLSTIEPRKNLLAVLRAFDSLPTKVKENFPLIVVGAMGWLADDLSEKLQSLQRTGFSRYLGYVPQSDLPAIIAGASLSLYPSLYEGYGMPVAESMACGTAVITSNVASMPEVAKGACILVDPTNEQEIASAMLQAFEDSSLVAQMVQRGISVSEAYAWEVRGKSLLAALRKIQSTSSL